MLFSHPLKNRGIKCNGVKYGKKCLKKIGWGRENLK
jgi:hypothetical protein